MALRRLAQTNNAATTTGSPHQSPQSSSASPASSAPSTPVTPRNRASFGIHRSPASTPSISSSIPFDWDAARSRRPPPYATPPQNKSTGGRKSIGVPGSTTGTPARRGVVRKKSLYDRVMSIPSRITFEVAIFPHNVPLPAPKTSAWILGGSMHFLHLCVRVSQVSKVPDSDLGWEDMYREGEGNSWFDWTVPMTILLIAASTLNTIYLFTHIKLYHLHHRPDPVSSPHATFVSAQLDFQPLKLPTLVSRIRSGAWYTFSYSWRFLLGMNPPSSVSGALLGKTARVQQLEVWTPGELEIMLFSVYSPAHALLWMATGSANWMLMFIIMCSVGVQLNIMAHSYTTLLKDKEIIAAEVMHEYNQGFVYPRVNPIRKDVAVMTHQSEVVNVWED